MSDNASTSSLSPSAPTPAAPAPLDLGLIASAFLRSLPVALTIAVIAAGVTLVVLSQTDPVYEVKTRVAVGSPTAPGLDAETQERLGTLYSSIATDETTRDLLEEETSQTDPSVLAGETAVPGVIEVRTRAGSVDEARSMAETVLKSMTLRSTFFYSESARIRMEEAERRTTLLQEQIDTRRAANPEADVTDLENEIRLISEETGGIQPYQVQPLVVSQSDNDGARVWPQMWATSLVVAMLAFLLAQVPLIIWRLRRPRRADDLWLRMMGRTFGVEGESAAVGGGLTPLAEARAAAVLAGGGNVLVLGDSADGEKFRTEKPNRLHHASWLASWWRELPPSDIQLGVVVIDERDRRVSRAGTAVERLVKSGVPTFLVIRSGEKRENRDGTKDRDRS